MGRMRKQNIKPFTHEPKTTGERIKYFRTLQGMTQEELGDEIGVARNTISEHEADVRPLRKERARSIAKVFNITEEQILVDHNAKKVKIERVPDEIDLAIQKEVIEVQDDQMKRTILGVVRVIVRRGEGVSNDDDDGSDDDDELEEG